MMNNAKLPLTSMDAGLLRQIAAKVDDDLIDVNDAKILRGIADSVDSVLEWCEGARSKEEVEEILFGDTQQPEDAPSCFNPTCTCSDRQRIGCVCKDAECSHADGGACENCGCAVPNSAKQALRAPSITASDVETWRKNTMRPDEVLGFAGEIPITGRFLLNALAELTDNA